MRVLNLLKKSLITILFVVIILLFIIISNQSASATDVTIGATVITPTSLNDLTNRERVNFGLKPLVLNTQLNDAAQAKAEYMIAKNYWAHDAPDGTTLWSFIISSGYQYTSAGENFVKDINTSSGPIEEWMKSPTNRENVLSAVYRDVGYAIVNGELSGSKTTLIVAIFGTRLNNSVIIPQSHIDTKDSLNYSSQGNIANASTSIPIQTSLLS